MTDLSAFIDWKQDSTAFVLENLDEKAYHGLVLPEVLGDFADAYATYLLTHGVVDDAGEPTGVQPDEDEMLEELLSGYLAAHPADEKRELLIASLWSDYLDLLQEYTDE